MSALGLVLRIFSFGFHLLLTLLMLAISSLAWMSGQHNLQIGLLPWQGASLTHWLFFAGLAGLIVTLLAIKRVLPLLFLIWSIAVLVMLVRGFFFSSYHFGAGAISLSSAFWIVLAALAAAVGGGFQVRQKRKVLRRNHALV